MVGALESVRVTGETRSQKCTHVTPTIFVERTSQHTPALLHCVWARTVPFGNHSHWRLGMGDDGSRSKRVVLKVCRTSVQGLCRKKSEKEVDKGWV